MAGTNCDHHGHGSVCTLRQNKLPITGVVVANFISVAFNLAILLVICFGVMPKIGDAESKSSANGIKLDKNSAEISRQIELIEKLHIVLDRRINAEKRD